MAQLHNEVIQNENEIAKGQREASRERGHPVRSALTQKARLANSPNR